MSEQGVNHGRRRFLTATTAVVGAGGAIFAAVPFVNSWKPSAKAQTAGAPVEVDIRNLEAGQRLIEMWRGQPVWIIRRTPEMLERLGGDEESLRDPGSDNPDQQPDYARNPYRSLKPDVLVLIGICTHLGCSPLFEPRIEPKPYDAQWKGGFFCPCHGSKFDLAGRVYAGVPAPTNLKVPPYRFVDDGRLVIGEDTEEAA